MPHFGLALSVPEFRELAARVAAAGIRCELGPRLRFEGQPGEQWTMFFRDPSGNALEFRRVLFRSGSPSTAEAADLAS